MSIKILSIDPGSTESGFVYLDKNLKPLKFNKIKNELLLSAIYGHQLDSQHIAIEMVACYGMSVGATVFDTCVWIGRFYEAIETINGIEPQYIYRKDEKMDICHNMKANDSTIKQALVDRFAYGVSNHGKGNKTNKGFFYGFKKDVWSAFAIAVTYFDKYLVTEMANKCFNK